MMESVLLAAARRLAWRSRPRPAPALMARYSDAAVAGPVKYENVRKLVVGLGNPGDKYAKTRHNIGSAAVAHFLETYASHVLGQPLTMQHEASSHGDVARFAITFQQDADGFAYRADDLVDAASARRKAKTQAEGVPHAGVNVALLLPDTYMNRSGTAVRAFMGAHRWRLKRSALSLGRQDELLVVADDVSLPFGTCRFKAKGGPGGQNGVRDVIKCVGSDRFARLKIGVGAPHWFAAGSTGAPAGTAMDRYVLARFNADEQEAMPALLRYVNELLRLYLHRGVAAATTVANSTDLATFERELAAKVAPK